MILIISTCKEKLHELEFVKPIEDILRMNNFEFKSVNYKRLTKKDLDKAEKVIISGTSLKDCEYLFEENIKKFNWIKDFKKPIFGICAGMQIISSVFNSELKNKKEIGFYNEDFVKEFLGLKEEQEVYHLHNNYPSLPKDFDKFTSSEISQAIKHKTKEIYAVLFHPEVRNKELIINFCNL